MRAPRAAYTILELVLVMAIIVVAASAGFPLMMGMLQDSRLPASADMIRAQLVEARNRAIVEGRPFSFEFEEEGSAFRIVPEGSDEEPDAKQPQDANKLLKEVLFGASNAPAGSKANFKVAATFLPNGTARADSEITLSMPDCRPLTLRIRALTGSVTQVEGDQP